MGRSIEERAMTRKDLIEQLGSGYDADFAFFMPFIFDAENAYGRDHKTIAIERVPGDNGGETVCGIDRESHPNFDFGHITPKAVCDTYLSEWDKEGIGLLRKPFKFCYFDCAVNAGVGRARRILGTTGQDASAFLGEREAFYRRLAAKVSHDRRFLEGWLNRIRDLRAFLKL
jgi:glycosyl hydrolase family 108